MHESALSSDVKSRLAKRVKSFKPKLSPKFRELLPFKSQIKELRERRAAYGDIRLILAEENIKVSVDTIFRFCRVVLNENLREPKGLQRPKTLPPAVSPLSLPAASSPASDSSGIQAAIQNQRDQRERLPGVWGRRKRGPRIADSKNL